MSGWIKLDRNISNHWVFKNSDYFKWWVDILLEVNHTPAKVVIKNKIYDCGRGEKLYSLDTWASRWNTNKSKVRRFLELLQKENMIELKSETQTTRLKVCKYDDYQEIGNTNETHLKRKRNANETHLTPIQERKEGKEEKENNIDPINWEVLLSFFNEKFNKKCTVVSNNVKSKFKARLKEGYTKKHIFNAIVNLSKDEYHIENKFKYVTLEFISRSNKLDAYGQDEPDKDLGTTNQKIMKYDHN